MGPEPIEVHPTEPRSFEYAPADLGGLEWERPAARGVVAGVKALALTYWRVLRRPSTLGTERFRPTSLRQARGFANRCAVLVAAGLLVALWLYAQSLDGHFAARAIQPVSVTPGTFELEWRLHSYAWQLVATLWFVPPVLLVLSAFHVCRVGALLRPRGESTPQARQAGQAVMYYVAAVGPLLLVSLVACAVTFDALVARNVARSADGVLTSVRVGSELFVGLTLVTLALPVLLLVAGRLMQASRPGRSVGVSLLIWLPAWFAVVLTGWTVLWVLTPWALGYAQIVVEYLLL